MHGPIRAESSAERAAREAAEAQQARAREQQRLPGEQNRLLAAMGPGEGLRGSPSGQLTDELERLANLRASGHSQTLSPAAKARLLGA